MRFRDRVQKRLEKEGWNVKTIHDRMLDFICTRRKREMAVKLKAHKHLNFWERERLLEHELKIGVPIFLMSVDRFNELRLIKLSHDMYHHPSHQLGEVREIRIR